MSFTTLSEGAVRDLTAMEVGVVVCVYRYKPEDALQVLQAAAEQGPPPPPLPDGEAVAPFYAVCYRSKSRSLNIMCGKKEVEAIRHQLASLRVLRTKIASTVVAYKSTNEAKDGEEEAEGVEGEEAGAEAAAGGGEGSVDATMDEGGV